MHTRSYIQSRSGSRDGVALIAVLVFIVLLTILTVSYISFTGLNRLSTTSYSKSIQAQEVAQGGLEDILSDLHNEIIAGSIKDPNGTTYTVNGTTIYIPATNQTAMPARIGYTNTVYNVTNSTPTQLSTTLIRVSRCTNNAGATFFTSWATSPYTNNQAALPGGLPIFDRASQASTTNSDVGGRYISAARWNKTFLLATNSLSTVIPAPFATNAPDWVYVTRTGSRSCLPTDLPSLKTSSNLTQNYGATTPGVNPPASPVVGRYAFVMYDEGALLDATVAGSPSSLINNSTVVATQSPPSLPIYTNSPSATPPIPTSLAFAGKSYLAFADLTQLPGLSGASGQTAINSLVNWRNAGGIASANTSYGNGYTGTGTSYLGAIFNYAPNAFLSFSSGDSPFVGRQDLINYFANYDAINGTTTSQALPFLGTFSRAVSASSYTPPADSQNIPRYITIAPPTPGLSASGPIAYKDNAESTGIANRDLANVRFANAGAITHYSDDATATPATYNVNVGDPLLQGRFSLAKINWLSQADPNAGTAPSGNYPAAIQACFGLVWGAPGSSTTNSSTSGTTANGGNPCWNYVGSLPGPSGSSYATSGQIETLDLVAKEGREPNFFELLKAAILSGSLGLGPGLAAFNNGADNSADGRNAPFDVRPPTPATDLAGAGGLFAYSFGSAAGRPAAPARIPDVQIIQIGANIIDQYDSDSYPTAIYFPYNDPVNGSVGVCDPVNGTSANALYGPVDMIYGDENLPLLSKMNAVICSPNPSGTNDSIATGPADSNSVDDNTHSLEGWLQPEIWNPHQQPASALPNVPHNFEIRAYGDAMTYGAEGGGWLASDMSVLPAGWSAGGLSDPASPNNWSDSNSNIQSYWTGTSSTESPTGANEEAGTITFTDTSTTSSLYATPRLLVLADANGITGLANVTSPLPLGSGTVAGNIVGPNFPYSAQPIPYTTTLNHFVGFTAGLISEAAGTPPQLPYYIGSDAENTPLFPGSAGPPVVYGNAPGAQTAISFPVTGTNSSGGASFAMGWLDSSNRFHPYSFITGAFEQAYMTLYDDGGHSPDGRLGSADPGYIQEGGLSWGLVDPRTSRFSLMTGNFVSGGTGPNTTVLPTGSHFNVANVGGIPTSGNFTSPQIGGVYSGNYACFPEDWMINLDTVITPTGSTLLLNAQRCNGTLDPRNGTLVIPGGGGTWAAANSTTFYADPDGVVRPGDGYYSSVTTGDGDFTFTSAGVGGTALGDTASGTYDGNSQHARRPVILNRPFRSVGELGYVFRDLPFKTLDFFTTSSADAALLDVFSLTDESSVSTGANKLVSVVAGQFNPNNAPLSVVQAVLSGGSKKDFDPTYNLGSESTSAVPSLAQAIVSTLNPTTGPQPLLNRAALVTQLSSVFQHVSTGAFGATITSKFTLGTDKGNKAYLESPIRALADVTNTRTWNLLIDIIAQSGQMSPTAKTLNDFVVQGEKRYWLHVAIDRYTGKVVAQQLEPVYE